MNDYHFSTVITDRYLYKLLVLHRTLEYHCNNFHLYVLCIEEMSYNILTYLQLKNVTLVQLKQIENEELLKAKANRTQLEYTWTLKPSMLNYVMTNFNNTRFFAHLDGDLCFFSDIKPIFYENKDALIYLTEHHNSAKYKDFYNKTGVYNTGFVGLKNDIHALEAVDWWKNRCIEWCGMDYKSEERLYGDQRYVERMPELFIDVHEVRSKGANVAAWNIDNYDIKRLNDKVMINNEELIFYHFSGFSIYNSVEFNLTWLDKVKTEAVDLIYLPYMHLISEAITLVNRLFSDFKRGFEKLPNLIPANYYRLR